MSAMRMLGLTVTGGWTLQWQAGRLRQQAGRRNIQVWGWRGRLESQNMLTGADLRLMLAGGVAQGRVMGLAQRRWLG